MVNRLNCYEIRVEGILPTSWSGWFEDMEIRSDPSGETILKGQVIDQAALFSILLRLHNLNLTLVSVDRLEVNNS